MDIHDTGQNSTRFCMEQGVPYQGPAPISIAAGLEKATVAQPVGARFCPSGVRAIVSTNAEIMSGVCIDVQFRRHTGALESEVHQRAVLWRADDILSAMHEKDRRGIGRDAQRRGQLVLVLGFQVTGINRDGEVWPAT